MNDYTKPRVRAKGTIAANSLHKEVINLSIVRHHIDREYKLAELIYETLGTKAREAIAKKLGITVQTVSLNYPNRGEGNNNVV